MLLQCKDCQRAGSRLDTIVCSTLFCCRFCRDSQKSDGQLARGPSGAKLTTLPILQRRLVQQPSLQYWCIALEVCLSKWRFDWATGCWLGRVEARDPGGTGLTNYLFSTASKLVTAPAWYIQNPSQTWCYIALEAGLKKKAQKSWQSRKQSMGQKYDGSDHQNS